MFILSDKTSRYILENGGHVTLKVERGHGYHESRDLETWIATASLGQPAPEERELFLVTERKGVTIWHAPEIQPIVGGRKIEILSKWHLRGRQLKLSEAKQYPRFVSPKSKK
ncbi:MAG: hypothetical protein ACM3QZ_13835 [Solirubrobacterales bacterium]